jgi:diketogulonate reductase-like aldo/keto reductase
MRVSHFDGKQALWQGLVQAKKEGLARAIGVSNFNATQLMALNGPAPAVNQIALSILPFWGNQCVSSLHLG